MHAGRTGVELHVAAALSQFAPKCREKDKSAHDKNTDFSTKHPGSACRPII